MVTSGDAILGIISERDIVRGFSQYGEAVGSMPVKDVMTHGLITASLGDDITHLMHLIPAIAYATCPCFAMASWRGSSASVTWLSIGWMIWNLKRAFSAMFTSLATDRGS